MTLDAWITVAVLGGMVYALASGRLSPAAAVAGSTALLFLAGVVDAGDAFVGYSSTAPMTIAALYVIAAAVSRTGALGPALAVILDKRGSERRSLARLLLPASAASAFLANTPIVALLVPAVGRWSNERKMSSSTFLIPLSYATILGGATTLIGTSTNLVVSGLLEESGFGGLGLFELAKIGLPIALVGLGVIVVVAPRAMPKRKRPREVAEGDRSFSLSMVVEGEGPLVGRTVGQAGLRDLNGVFLVEIDRNEEVIAPVGPDTVLAGDDRLIFVGNLDQVVDLQQLKGLRSAEEMHLMAVDDGRHVFFEAVIGPGSPLVGNTLKELDFRSEYRAAVLAIHRSGERVAGKLGQVDLHIGDTLLLLADRGFRSRYRDRRDFLLVSRFDGDAPPVTSKAPIALLGLAAVVALPALGLLSVPRATIAAVIGLVAAGVLSPRDARDAVDVNVVLMIGAAFGLGRAVQVSGLGDVIAEGILDSLGSAGTFGAILGVIVGTMVLTELITNAAAVTLMFPIATTVAAEVDIDPRLLAIGMAVAASSSFLTPIGYQTNTMVYGPGGYRFTDYLRLGVPLSLISVFAISALVTIQG